jgi:hypothetical protein
MGQDRSVSKATRYWLQAVGIKSRWGRDFLHLPRLAWGPPNLLYNGEWVFFPAVRCGLSMAKPPTSSAEVKEMVQLHLYSPSGPSWPILGWTLLLPVYKIMPLEVTPPLYFPLPAITCGSKTLMVIPELKTTLNVGFWNYVWRTLGKILFLRPHCYRVQHNTSLLQRLYLSWIYENTKWMFRDKHTKFSKDVNHNCTYTSCMKNFVCSKNDKYVNEKKRQVMSNSWSMYWLTLHIQTDMLRYVIINL